MIKKERLQELIEQNAIVYYVAKNEICQLELTYKHNIYLTVEGYYICLYGNNGLQIYGDKLFESKAEAEDAEWYHEFANVERTERLIFPTWEEFKKFAQFSFYDLDRFCRYFVYFDLKNIVIKEYYEGGDRVIFSEPLTKENFILACRKCKELFIGET